jgi:predicted small secreted protein
MKRVALLPLLLALAAASAGCVTYDGVDENGKHSRSRTLIECRQSGAIACRMLPQFPKGQTLDDVTYMRLPK